MSLSKITHGNCSRRWQHLPIPSSPTKKSATPRYFVQHTSGHVSTCSRVKNPSTKQPLVFRFRKTNALVLIETTNSPVTGTYSTKGRHAKNKRLPLPNPSKLLSLLALHLSSILPWVIFTVAFFRNMLPRRSRILLATQKVGISRA